MSKIIILNSDNNSEDALKLFKKQMPKGADCVVLIADKRHNYQTKRNLTMFEGCEGELICGKSLATPVKNKKFGTGMYAGVPKKKSDFEEMEWREEGVRSTSTGYITKIDEILNTGVSDIEVDGHLRSQYTVEEAIKLILVAFPDKDPTSVRKVLRARPRGIEKQKTIVIEHAPRWAKAVGTGGSGFMNLIDAQLEGRKFFMLEIIEEVLEKFPLDHVGVVRDEKKLNRLISNRARINRKQGLDSGIKVIVRVKKEKPTKKVVAKKPAKKAAKKAPAKKATKKAAKKTAAKKNTTKAK
jgi:hypothetical protein